MFVTGACHCQAIRYEAEVDPTGVRVCHCTDCQVLSGSAFRVSVQVRPGAFRILAGAPRIYTKTAESGRPREQGFCDRCGTPIYATSSGPEPKVHHLRLGTVHQRAQLPPLSQIWARSRLPWAPDVCTLPQFEREP